MYAVIKAGGKQQKVTTGDVIEVELMHADGDTVELHPLLVVDDDGKTHVGKEAQKAVVVARLVGEQKGEKKSSEEPTRCVSVEPQRATRSNP